MNISLRQEGKIEIQNLDFFSFAATYPTFFSAKKVAKKLESGMRSFSPILSHTETSVPFGDLYISVSRLRSIHLKGIERSRDARYPSLISIQSFSYASFHFKK